MKVYIVFENYQLSEEWALMEVFDSRIKANGYIKKKQREHLKDQLENANKYNSTLQYEIKVREVM